MAEEMTEKGIKSMKIFLILLVINFILLLLLFLFCACKVASMADRHIDNDIVENNK